MNTQTRTKKSGWLACVAAAATAGAVVWLAGLLDHGPAARAASAEGKEPMLAHNVYFTLKESTPDAREKLVEACHKYLSDHPGIFFYAAGTVSDLDRPVNDRDFDVGLHIVFADRAAHDSYQSADQHLKFIEENKASFKTVRVFDSDVTGADK